MTTKRVKIFYGWWIVAAAFTAMFTGIGIIQFTFGVFIKPLGKEFGWGRGAISLAHSISSLATGLVGPLVGKWIHQYGPRIVMTLGAFVMGISFSSLYLMNSLWHLYFFYLALGLGYAALTTIPCATVVSHWFNKRRGLAWGIAMIGSSIGGMIFPSISRFLIDKFDWALAYFFIGLMFLAIPLPMVVLIIRTKPEDMGLLPDGEEGMKESKAAPQMSSAFHSQGMTSIESFKTLSFWMLALALLLAHVALTGVMLHLFPFLTDRGITSSKAALIFGSLSGMGILGRLLFGHLADIFPKRYVLMMSYLCLGLGIVILETTTSMPALYAFVTIFGIGLGGKMTTEVLAVSDCFGLASFGVILGYLRITQIGGGSLGPITSGYIFDLTKSYHLAFLVFIISYLIAMGVLLFTRPYKSLSEKPVVAQGFSPDKSTLKG